MKIVKIVLVGMLLFVTLIAQDKLQATKSSNKEIPKELPKTVGFTEVQKLKAENYQLKLVQLETQMKSLQKEYVDLLQGVLKGAGLTESDWEQDRYDSQAFVFTKVEKKPEPEKKP